MDYKDIVLIVLVIGMLFIATKVYKNNNIEKFQPEQVNLIKEEINRQYNMDIESIRNLGAISKSLLTGTNYHSTESANPGTLTIPADTIIEGNTLLKGKVEFEHKDTMLMDILPKYMVIAWANSEGIPEGWAVCDGKNGTPDLRGRFVLGAGEGENLTKRKLNETSGAETHTLTVDEMPSHGHDIYRSNWMLGDFAANYRFYAIKTSDNAIAHGGTASYHKADDIGQVHYIKHTGGGQPHNNMPPFYVLIYIMKL